MEVVRTFFMRRLLALVDKWSGVPPDFDPEALFRVRFLYIAAVPGALISLSSGVADYLWDKGGDPMDSFIGIGSCLLVVLAWSWSRSLQVCAHVVAAYDAILFVYLTSKLGDPSMLSWLVVPGILALLIGGYRAGALWIPLTLFAATALSVLFGIGAIEVGPQPTILERVWRVAPMPLVILFLVVLFEYSRQRSLVQARAAQKVAERAHAARRRFLASVSHEIRTPLNGVLGVTDLLLAGPLEPSLRESLSVIESSGATLRTLINDLLDLSAAEAGRLALTSAPFEVSERIGAAIRLCQAAVKGLTLEVRDELPKGLRLMGDGQRLGQVLTNLLQNAVKFTERGVVSLTARASRRGQNWALNFEVADTGTGISAEQQAKLFQPFSQLDNARGRGGTGLGLAICRELIEKMSGTLQVESTEGAGSTFRVRLELPPAPEIAAPAPVPSQPLSVDGRALVVDDNPVNARVAKGLLEKLGLTVDWAADGMEALERLGSHHFDLVLMDCEMPRLDGLSATRAWRERETDRRLPIIALTADAQQENLEACLKAGMDAALTKPVQMGLLRDVVAKWVRPPRSERGADDEVSLEKPIRLPVARPDAGEP